MKRGQGLTVRRRLSPRTRASTEPRTTSGIRNPALRRARGGRSSSLRFQMLDVETFSFLPKGQGDGRDLARQGEARQLAAHHPVVGAGARHQRQASVGLQLSLTAKAMRGLQQGDQQSDPHRAERRDAAQNLLGGVPTTLGQHRGARLLAQRHQQVQLLIEQLGARPHP